MNDSYIPNAGEDTHWNSPYSSIIQVVVWAIIVFLSLETIIGNAMVIVAYKLERAISKQVSNRYIVSLAVSDLIIGVEGYPLFTLYVLNGDRWPLGWIACETWLFLDYTLCLVSILTVLLITVDRYLSVCHTASYIKWQTPAKTQLTIFLSWLIPAFIFGIMIYGWPLMTGSASGMIGTECSAPFLSNPYVNMGMYVVYYWTTLIAMLILYKGIHKAAKNLEQKAKAKERRHIALILSQRLGTQVGVSLMLSQNDGNANITVETPKDSGYQTATTNAAVSTTCGAYGSDESAHNLEVIREETERSSVDMLDGIKLETVPSTEALERRCSLASNNSLPDDTVTSDYERKYMDSGSYDFQAADSLSLLFNDDSFSSVLQLKSPAACTDSGVEFADSEATSVITKRNANIKSCLSSAETKRDSDSCSDKVFRYAPLPVVKRMPSTKMASSSWVQHVKAHMMHALRSPLSSNAMSRPRISSTSSGSSSSDESRENDNTRFTQASVAVTRQDSERSIATTTVEKSKNDFFLSPGGMTRKISSLSALTRERMVHAIFAPFSAFQRQRKQTRAERRAHKAFRTITFIVGFFTILWSPYYVVATVYGFCRGHCIPAPVYTLSYYMCYLNSSGNPFAYALANRQFRSAFLRMLRGNFNKAI
uniref:G protein linked acetylcholine receptor isoform a n=1 Tax=Ascaris suum TaxID=6253 RepID=C0KJK0_ASCSU|nr:G protein linked acetylcholine receptor isoform a [Ascaris suum]